jgi:alkanesulfonate monooxygenase SsuD/methylene tetrahydromethanopterin reductase-like flavin-dependent oxidoreductase (luciferase family)
VRPFAVLRVTPAWVLNACYPAMPDEVVNPEYLLDRNWIAGDPDECARKIRQVYEKVGGFGHLLMLVYDWEPR